MYEITVNPMSRFALAQLPEPVVERLVRYLDQQLLVNLALTNYTFYPPAMRRLYARLAISVDKTAPEMGDACDFAALLATVVYGYANRETVRTPEAKVTLLAARLAVLNTAMDVNHELAGYVKVITIDVDPLLMTGALQEQLTKLLTRRGLHLDQFTCNSNAFAGLAVKAALMTVWNSLDVAALSTGAYVCDASLDVSGIPPLVSELVLPVENYQKQLATIGVENMRLKTFRWVLNDVEDASEVLMRIGWNTVENLELVVTSSPNNVLDLLEVVPPLPRLKRILIVQKNPGYDTHVLNETYDLAVLAFVLALVMTLPYLHYVAIVHEVPIKGNFADGYEGNYLRRKQIFGHELARVVAQAPDRKIDVVLPNLLCLLACYDQAMNNMLWNGCKCHHCLEYLGSIDNFLLHHRYYLQPDRGYKDINSLLLFRTIGEALFRRYVFQPTWLFADSMPLKDWVWNFHLKPPPAPFRCYADDIHEDGHEWDEVDVSAPTLYLCSQWTELAYHGGVPKAMAHYLNTIMVSVVNLQRDNAEDEVIGLFMNDGGDGDYKLNIQLALFNGINYWVGRETNGTHFFMY